MGSQRGTTGTQFLEGVDERVVLDRYQGLLDALEGGVCQVTGQGQIGAVTDDLLELTGLDRDVLVGAHLSQLFDSSAATPLQQALENGETETTLEASVRTADTNSVRCDVRVLPHPVSDPEGGGLLVVRRRPAAMPRTEDTLPVADNDLVRTLIDAAKGGIFVLDESFEVVWADDTVGDYFGVDPGELIGQNKRTVLEEYITERVADPEGFSERILSSYESNDYVEEFECHVTPGDGREERWLEHWSRPIDSGPYEGGRVENYTDITDRKRSASAELETQERFQSLVDAVTEYAIFRLDQDGRVVSWNEGASTIKGYDPDEILGEHVSRFYTEADRTAGVPEQNLAAARTDGSVEDEGWRVRKDGSRFWANVTITAIQDADGTNRGFLKVTKDMTERHEREKEMEGELRHIMSRVSDAFFAVDEDWYFTHVNERALELFARPREEVLDERLWQVFPLGRDWNVPGQFQEAMRTQDARSFEFEDVEHGCWLDVTAYPSETGLSVYLRDVTERHEKQRQVREREQELEQYKKYTDDILDAIDDLFYVIDEDGAFQRWNESLSTMTGYSDEEVAEMVPLDFIADTDKEAIAEAIGSVFETGSERVMATLETKDGTPIPMEFAASRVETADGKTALAGIGRDVSDRIERERKLQESRRRYKTLVDNFPRGAVGLFSEDLTYIAIGGEILDKIDVDPPTNVSETLPSNGNEQIVRHCEQSLNGRITSFDFGFDGWYFHARTIPIENADGRIEAGMIVIHDVTERRRYQRQLEESNERLEQFAYAASHDLQEPLRMVSSYLQLIDQRYNDALDEDGQEFLEFAVDGAERMRNMIDGLLAYSRIESEGDTLQPVDLEDVLDAVRANLRVKLDETDARLTADSLPRVRGDERQLQQLFQNLLDNALEYSGDEPPSIHVSAAREQGRWVVTVQDQGIGIGPDDADRVFDLFQSLHGPSTHGTGIGLALCERIVDRHGGKIWVESDPGEGSSFRFTLVPTGDADE